MRVRFMKLYIKALVGGAFVQVTIFVFAYLLAAINVDERAPNLAQLLVAILYLSIPGILLLVPEGYIQMDKWATRQFIRVPLIFQTCHQKRLPRFAFPLLHRRMPRLCSSQESQSFTFALQPTPHNKALQLTAR